MATAAEVIAGGAAWGVDCSDALAGLRYLPDGCVDAVVTDPPYPEVDRDYGRLTVPEWRRLVYAVVLECRRVLAPSGSALFILQPNSEAVGRIRPWLWDFMGWACRKWNMVQDAWWWNTSAPPTVHCHRARGLMRPSLKACVWLGAPDCYRDQESVLWLQSVAMAAGSRADDALRRTPSGFSSRKGRIRRTVDARGGVTPFNVIPLPNTESTHSGGAHGHGASTPEGLCAYWVRYLSSEGALVLDPFCGSGTVGLVARRLGRRFVGFDLNQDYCDMARRRIADDQPLFSGAAPAPAPSPERTLFDSLAPKED